MMTMSDGMATMLRRQREDELRRLMERRAKLSDRPAPGRAGRTAHLPGHLRRRLGRSLVRAGLSLGAPVSSLGGATAAVTGQRGGHGLA